MKLFRTAWRTVAFPVALVGLAAKLAWRLRFVPIEAKDRYRAEFQMQACRTYCRILGVQVTVRGRDRSTPMRPFLAVSNHVGVLDGLVLASIRPIAFVVKAEMASWPVIGWVCRVVGMIFVERDRHMGTREFVNVVRKRIVQGVTVMVFPEGTVGNTRALLPFQTGAFEAVANGSGLEILPVYLHATHASPDLAGSAAREAICWKTGESMARHAIRILGYRRVEVEVRLGQPLPTVNRDRKELSRMSRKAVEELGRDTFDL